MDDLFQTEAQVLFLGGSMNGNVASVKVYKIPFEIKVPNCTVAYASSDASKLVPKAEWDDVYKADYFISHDKVWLVAVTDNVDLSTIEDKVYKFILQLKMEPLSRKQEKV